MLLKLYNRLSRPLCKGVVASRPLIKLYRTDKTKTFPKKEDIDLSKPQTAVLFGDTIVCWHPDSEFPFENSRPIDLKKLEKVESSSVFKDQLLEGDKQLRPKQGPSNPDLQEIFYTSSTRFNPIYREKKLYAVSAPIPRRK